ncbi:MAG: phosphatidylglycerol lysyltransferase domain-containing protein [Bacillota bacterium]
MDYKKIEIADKSIFDEHFAQCHYEISEFTFTNLFIWRRAYNLMWCKYQDVLLVKGLWNDLEFLFFPIGQIDNALQVVKVISAEQPIQLRSVPKIAAEQLAALLPNARVTTAEDDYDYVYSSEDLAKLAGRKFEKKRHHINKLLRTYPQINYREFDDDLLEKITQHTENWYQDTLSEDIWLNYERVAINDVLVNWRPLGVRGAALVLQNRVVAFTVGEQLNSTTAVIHIEKADFAIDGAYQLINREFVKNSWNNFQYINREEDMGLPQLRVAKKSYHPIKMVEKYIVDIG